MRILKVNPEADRELLEKLYKIETDYRVKQRLLMVIHVIGGKTAKEVGEMLLCDNHTVSKWVKRFNKDGIEGLKDQERQGAPRKVNYQDLRQALDKKPKEFGYDWTVWFPTLVYNYLRDFQKVEIAFDYVYVLIKNLGYSLVVPRTKSYKSNPDKVVLFKKKVRKL